MDKWQKSSLAGIGISLLTFAGFAGTKGYNASAAMKTPIEVTVIGAVRKPGLITVESGTIVQKAIDLAGGSLPGADLTSVDLGTKLTSKATLSIGDSTGRAAGAPDTSSLEMSSSSMTYNNYSANQAKPREASLALNSISLNSATLQELERLPKIGPATAQRIVQHRATIGQFTSIEQLDDVKGIGPKTLQLIRPYLKL